MGLDTNGVKFLLACQKQGVSLKRTLMIGRQIHNLEVRELKENLLGFGKYQSDEQVRKILSEKGGYAEPFLQMLGAEHIDSLDFSDYEGANILQDMNLPIPEDLKQRYSTVLESGSLEHIFNLPVSLANCMEMVEKDGYLLIITPVNNIMGHGFYQFSPELFYRVLNERNGFDLEQMLIFEYSPEEKWYSVKDPKTVKQRVELMNSSATYLCVKARRTEIVPILLNYPQQSDYEDAWEGRENYYTKIAQDRDSIQPHYDPNSPKNLIKKLLPHPFLDFYRAYMIYRRVKFNTKFYKEVDIWKL